MALTRHIVVITVVLSLSGCAAFFTPKRKKVRFEWNDSQGKVGYGADTLYTSGQKMRMFNYEGSQYTFAKYVKKNYKPITIPIERRKFNRLYFLDLYPPLFTILVDFLLSSRKAEVLNTKHVKVNDHYLVPIPTFADPKNFIRSIYVTGKKINSKISFYPRTTHYFNNSPSFKGPMELAILLNPAINYQFKRRWNEEFGNCRQNYINEFTRLKMYNPARELLAVSYNKFDLEVKIDSVEIAHIGDKKWSSSYSFSPGVTKARVRANFILTSYTGETLIDTSIAAWGNFDFSAANDYISDAFQSVLYVFLSGKRVANMFNTNQEKGYQEKLVINRSAGPLSLDQAVNSTVTITSGKGLSSGCIISNDGYILANLGSIEDTKNMEVMLSNERKFKAQLVRQSAKMNTALIKIDTTGLVPLEVSFKPEEYIAQEVFIAGTPVHSNLHNSLSRGFLSAVRKTDDWKFVQTSAVMSKGHKGGAILSSSGQLLAILNHRVKSSSTSKISFGISMEDVCKALEIEFSK